ncbi:CHAP domain-containing protein [Zavarzinia sp. CC-PAN008]|uniref:CHAP domain-containing protein n=1 Tax=Zavarzinia sp. CC-PAN008 TaxID=3243332 RepID=UPI003F742185
MNRTRPAWVAAFVFVFLGLFSGQAFAIECVPYARDRSGIMIRGDAWTWWASAQGTYRQGRRPEPGAVMVFRRHGGMRRGHVAVVRQIIDSRTVSIDHANWAPARSGLKGAIARNVRVIDTSARNDWSSVRVWYAPTGSFGIRNYPVYGFIYPDSAAIRRAPRPERDLNRDVDMRMAALEDAGSASGSTDFADRLVPASRLRLSNATILPRAKPGQADTAVETVALRTTGSSTAPRPRARPQSVAAAATGLRPAAAPRGVISNQDDAAAVRLMAPVPDGLLSGGLTADELPVVPRVRPAGLEGAALTPTGPAAPLPRARPGQG